MSGSTSRLTYAISSLSMGGAQRGMIRLLPFLDREYEVTVVALRGGDRGITSHLPDSVTVVVLDVQTLPHLSALAEFRAILENTDVLVCSLQYAALVGTTLGRLTGVPAILTWQHNEEFSSAIRRDLFRPIVRLSDAVLADSEAVATMLERTFPGSGGTVVTVPIAGIDTERFKPVERGPGDETVVGMLGRLVEQKNHEAVLAAADRLRDASLRFEIAGRGPREAELVTLTEERNLDNVNYRGFVHDVPSFLNELDVYVQPSRFEGLCITAVEAMACGLPVVATAVGGLTETVVHGQTGYLVDPGDTDAFVSRILELHRDPDKRTTFGRRSRARVVEHYSRDVLERDFQRALSRARITE